MELGDRMKFYENGSRFIPTLPIIARIDGRNFHKYTKDAAKPFDGQLQHLFKETAKTLVQQTAAILGYTQSDEISLVFLGDWNSRVYFDGKIQKMVSCLASEATLYFNNIAEKPAMFDCRCFQVPSLTEASNYFVWREQDAVRNSVQMAARSIFSNKECNKKNNSQLQDMLMDKGINWNNYDSHSKRGTYFKRVRRLFDFPAEHLDKVNPDKLVDGKVMRSVVEEVNFPILTTIVNREELLFGNSANNHL